MDFIIFFTNVGPNLAKNISIPEKDVSIYDYLEGKVDHTMFLSPVDDQEIIRTVQNCKNKSTDYSDINMSLIKNVIKKIVQLFGHICHVSFQTGVFPSKMKIAKVVPLFKCREKNVFTNYRPISLLPQFSKIQEKLYNNRMDEFLKKYEILSPSQYGFRSNMSTTHALLELVEEITSSLDNNKYAIGVFVDLKKAFDTVDHDILAKKLHFYGVRGVAHKWILSYLKNRQQFVNCYNCDTEILNVSCGFPQGSILGPKFFIMYNDICKVSKYQKCLNLFYLLMIQIYYVVIVT